MTKVEIKKSLAEQLKKEHCFWSFNDIDIQEIPDNRFEQMSPKYSVTSEEIELYIKSLLMEKQ